MSAGRAASSTEDGGDRISPRIALLRSYFPGAAGSGGYGVMANARSSASVIDLTTALPANASALDDALADALRRLAATDGCGELIRRNRIRGFDRDAQLGARWLSTRLGRDLDPAQIVLTNGTQSALSLLFSALVPSGAALVTESLTYAVLRQIGNRAGLRLRGVALDEEGMIPEALEEAFADLPGPRILFCNPTVHNPTTAVMGIGRRQSIVDVCRRHGVAIIEDDVLGFLHRDAPPPIAAIAPDITWYCMSVSKCLAMGLRMAYLVAPSALSAARVTEPVRRLSSWFPNSLSALIVAQWIESEAATGIAMAMAAEIAKRHQLAAEVLADIAYVTKDGALHIWMPLPAELPRQAFATALEQRAVLIRPADLFSVDDADIPNAVRISLTGPDTGAELKTGLSIVSKTFLGWSRGSAR
ncbi:aminotransferase-like domain-containing protein [Mesorhizobium sp. L48C026A00]|uniref:aminotransferase-like domain-containing protein n=2 Tax=Phyllobacteriaceae TaxID=69277 RepID=UPI000A0ED8E1|nr:PLP-dependent aminotransferase family protein [Mesorhizobium sp. L48C026A00]